MRTQDENLTRAILAALNTQPGVRLVILFGSLAACLERVDSDLDLAVDAGHRLTADEKLALMNKLAERTGRSVDLVDLHAVGEPLLAGCGKTLWARRIAARDMRDWRERRDGLIWFIWSVWLIWFV